MSTTDDRVSDPATSPRAATAARPRRRLAAVARGLAVLTLTVLGAGLVGATTESVLSRGDDERYPAPGALVATDHGSLHVHCTGTGSPTVLLEAGLGEPGMTWVDIQRDLAQSLTVCSYDRAGYGWSPPADGDWDARVAATQAVQALHAAGHDGPYVVVAHSVGALIARELRRTDPDAVAGMVLLDPTNEVTLARVGTPAAAIAERTAMGMLARTGVVRLLGDRLIPALVGSQPPRDLLDRAPAAYHPGAVAASLRELRGAPAAATHLLANEDADWAELPLAVVSAATTSQQDHGHHRDLASRSAAGRHLTADVGGHYIHYDDRDLVITAICGVVAATAKSRGC